MRLEIRGADQGKTVRAFLREQGVSAALLARLKRREKGILLNGVRVTVRATLRAGDLLEIAVEDAEKNEGLLPLAAPLEVLFENEDLVAVNKPPFMPTHPSHGHYEDTLANVLYYHYGGQDPSFRPRFINRLDRNTSGVVLVAKHAMAAAALSRSMAERRIKKAYLALASGAVTAPAEIRTGIRRRSESIIFRETCAIGEGDLAVTEMTPLFADPSGSLVALFPLTGRTHQLRVHMASLGHPLLGDDLYGDGAGLPRQALHAAELCFPLPRSGELLSVRAPLPPDLKEALSALGKEALDIATTKKLL